MVPLSVELSLPRISPLPLNIVVSIHLDTRVTVFGLGLLLMLHRLECLMPGSGLWAVGSPMLFKNIFGFLPYHLIFISYFHMYTGGLLGKLLGLIIRLARAVVMISLRVLYIYLGFILP